MEYGLASPSVTVTMLGLVLPEFPFLSDSGMDGPQGTLGGKGDAVSLTSGRKCMLWDGLGPWSPCRYCKLPPSASLSPQLHGEGYLLQKVVSINKVASSNDLNVGTHTCDVPHVWYQVIAFISRVLEKQVMRAVPSQSGINALAKGD